MALGHDMEQARSLGDRLREIRDVLLSSGRFQRFAAAFPLTQPIARRRAADLFDLCAGFVYSQVLVACVRLRVFQQLQSGPLTVAVLSARSSIPPDAMAVLLDAAAALRLLEKRGEGRYGLGPLGAAMLGNSGIAAMVEHHAALYADLADPIGLLRNEPGERRLADYWPYAGGKARSLTHDAVSPYTALMSASQPMVAEMVLSAYSFRRHRCLLDIGGGDGSFLIAVGQTAPQLELQLLDLPEVAAIANDKFTIAGLGTRAKAIGGDFLTTSLPRGADIISLIRVVHDHDDDAVLDLLARIREVLPQDGVLVIGEPMSASRGGADPVSAYFALYLHAMGSGRPRSFAALQTLLARSGYSDVRPRRTRIPMIAGVVVARR